MRRSESLDWKASIGTVAYIQHTTKTSELGVWFLHYKSVLDPKYL